MNNRGLLTGIFGGLTIGGIVLAGGEAATIMDQGAFAIVGAIMMLVGGLGIKIINQEKGE